MHGMKRFHCMESKHLSAWTLHTNKRLSEVGRLSKEPWQAEMTHTMWFHLCEALKCSRKYTDTHMNTYGYCCLVTQSCPLSTPWTVAQTLDFPVLHCLPEFAQIHVPIEWAVLSNCLILCHPLLLLPSIFPSIRVFSNELALCIRWLRRDTNVVKVYRYIQMYEEMIYSAIKMVDTSVCNI